MRQVDLNANNSVNGPVADSLIRVYRKRHGRLDETGARLIRAAVLRIKDGVTTLEMERSGLNGGFDVY